MTTTTKEPTTTTTTTPSINKNTSSATTMEPTTKTSITSAALCAWQTPTVPYKPARSFDNTSPTMGSTNDIYKH
jgi:hypothetical protein